MGSSPIARVQKLIRDGIGSARARRQARPVLWVSGRQRTHHRLPDRPDQRRGGGVHVLGGELAGLDSIGDHLGHQVAIAVPEAKALDLDRRVDRLGEQRPGEPAAAEGAAGEGLDPDRDPLGGRPADPFQRCAHRVGADGDPGAVRNRGDRRGDVAALRDQLAGARRDAGAGLGAAGLGSLGAAIGHGKEVNQRSLLVSRRLGE